MQHNLFGSGDDLDLRSNLQHEFSRSNYISMTLTWGQICNMTFQCQIIYHSTRLDKRNKVLVKEMLCRYWVKCYYRKTFIEKRLFFSFCSLEAKPLILNQIYLRAYKRKSVKRDIECAFAQHCSSFSSPVMCQFVEKCWNRPNLTLGDLWWPYFWPDLKNDQSSFVMIFWRSFECRLPRVATGSRSRDRGGGGSQQPPAGGGKSKGPAGHGLNMYNPGNTEDICTFHSLEFAIQCIRMLAN